MTPRNIFRMLLRIMGVILMKDIVASAIGLYYTVVYGDSSDLLGLELSGIALYCGVIFILLFKTELIIDKLKLDNGFNEEDFSFYEDKKKEQLDTTVLLNMAFIVSALYILITQVPIILRDLANYYAAFRANVPNTTEMLVLSAGKILLAIIVLTYHGQIVTYIETRSGKKERTKN